ncbi:MAG: hypothetical protein ACYDBB_12970 [Armatimonadota bacterium]
MTTSLNTMEHATDVQSGAPALQFLWREAVVLVVILAAQHGPSIVGALTMLLLIAWSVRSNRAAMQALTISVLLTYLNPALTTPPAMMAALKWLLLFVACGVCIIRTYRAEQIPRWMLYLGAFVFAVGLLAMVTSAEVVLSLFKLFSFTAGAIVALTVFQGQSQPVGYAKNWLYTVSCVVLGLSLPLLAVSSGYLPNTHFFRGIMAHSQAYAIYTVPMLMFLFANLLIGRAKSVVNLLILTAGALTIYQTGSRTAMLAGIGGMFIAGLVVLCWRADLRSMFSRGRALTILGMGTIGLLILLVVAGKAIQQESRRFFLVKNRATVKDVATLKKLALQSGLSTAELKKLAARRKVPSLSEAFASSRGGLIAQSLDNFKQSPLTGVGFGMASVSGVGMVTKDPIFGLPISAPVEQGFFPTATLGQLGIIGSALLLLLLGALFIPIFRYASLPVMMLCSTAFLVNFGEMIFYSTGGIGLYMWLLLGFCYEESRRARQAACA